MLGIKWPIRYGLTGRGLFKEAWSVYYEPEQTLAVIEKAVWGNTLSEAVIAYNTHLSKDITSISDLVDLLEQVIPADLPALVEEMTSRLGHTCCFDNRRVGDDEDYSRYGECGSLRECAELGLRESQRYAERHDGPRAGREECWFALTWMKIPLRRSWSVW